MGKKTENFSIIDKGLSIEGIVKTNGRLIIKGSLKGTLSGNAVVIAEEGKVQAEAKVASMTVGGTFEGEVEASQELIVLATGKCQGRIVCKDLVVEAGGVVNANITCVNTGLKGDDKTLKKSLPAKDSKGPVTLT